MSDLEGIAKLSSLEGNPMFMMRHIDAKSSAPLPHQSESGTGITQRFTVHISGSADFVSDGVNVFCMDQSCSQASAQTIINELIFDVLLSATTEVVLI